MHFAILASMSRAAAVGRPYEQELSSRLSWLLGDLACGAAAIEWLHAEGDVGTDARIIVFDDPADDGTLGDLKFDDESATPTLAIRLGRDSTEFESIDQLENDLAGSLANSPESAIGFPELQDVILRWLSDIAEFAAGGGARDGTSQVEVTLGRSEGLVGSHQDFLRIINAADSPLNLTRRVLAQADVALAALSITDGDDRLLVSLLDRAARRVRGVAQLAQSDNFEVAETVARQLFEIRVNIEYLSKRVDQRKARLSYAKYGVLQSVLYMIDQYEYARSTGRTVSDQREQAFRDFLKRSEFDEFRAGKNGDRWVSSWTRKSVRALAVDSDSELLGNQYKLLYGAWSRQVHVSPNTVLSGVSPFGSSDSDAVLLRALRTDEIVSIALMLFLEIWRFVHLDADPTKPQQLDHWFKESQARLSGSWKKYQNSTGHDPGDHTVSLG